MKREKSEELNVPKKKKSKVSFVISLILLVFFSAVFVISLGLIIQESLIENETEATIEKIKELQPIDEGSEESAEAFFTIDDFTEYENINSDTIGWFYMPCYTSSVGLPVSLPLVWEQGGKDYYYLKHDFYKDYTENGWVFLSSGCYGEDLSQNKNLLIYGHARSYKMFGGLKDLDKDTAWQNLSRNHYIKISTPTEDTVWEIFSWYETTISSNFFYWKTAFTYPDEFIQFCYQVQDHDQLGCFNKFEFDENSRILTLSTCKSLNEDLRVAVHAKLIASRPRTLQSEKTENTSPEE